MHQIYEPFRTNLISAGDSLMISCIDLALPFGVVRLSLDSEVRDLNDLMDMPIASASMYN